MPPRCPSCGCRFDHGDPREFCPECGRELLFLRPVGPLGTRADTGRGKAENMPGVPSKNEG
jgi:predicted  nucleic acid-binding Zn-ribbon protein